MPTIITIIIAVVAFIVAAVITRFLTISSLTKDADSKIGSAETRAREIIDDAYDPSCPGFPGEGS